MVGIITHREQHSVRRYVLNDHGQKHLATTLCSNRTKDLGSNHIYIQCKYQRHIQTGEFILLAYSENNVRF